MQAARAAHALQRGKKTIDVGSRPVKSAAFRTMSVVPWGHEFALLAARHADRPAVGETTFAALMGRAAALAAALRRDGDVTGQPIATFLRNGVPAVCASYGLMLAGACETALNPQLADAELAHCLGLGQVRRVITERANAPRLRDLGVAVLAVEALGDAREAVDPGWSAPTEAWGKLIFTSGTTGKPKGIVHSQHGRWLANQLLRAHLPFVPEPGNRVLLMTPFSHGAALLTYAFLDHGAAVELIDGVDVARVRDLLTRRAVDCLFAPPTVLAKLTAAFAGARFDGLRCLFTGTATLTPALYRATRAMFGPVVRVTYGKSEIFNPITVLGPADCDAFYAGADGAPGVSLGWPAAGVEIAIRDEAGAPLEPGAVGEIHLRARHMLVGQIDAAGFHPQGDDFHATGDVGYLDPAGALHLCGRARDLIKSGGYKIYPEEIERALAGAAGAAAVAVVGVPSDYWGQIIVAVAEAPPADWPARGAACAAGLTRYKQPRAYLALPAFPRGGQDKLQRAKLIDALAARFRLVDGPHPRFETP
jgi:acyl-CoA synthetase (AMP-forming)/AMP-acid ligase II